MSMNNQHSHARRTAFSRWLERLAVLICFSIGGMAQDAGNLTELTLEELLNIEVTSVSKKQQKLSAAGAAAYVITRDDIRHSGMTNLPDLLRMAPGVNVARITANAWAISIRGFNSRYSNKVLVLIDGRSVYTPGFSGVFWDQQSVPLEDIDRIEVIRGPGGTAWGANAVNGLINIITRDAADTQGFLVSVGAGSADSAQGYARYGGRADSGSYRVYGRYFNVENAVDAGGSQAADGWHGAQLGFRSDWSLSQRDTLTVQGDVYRTEEGQTLTAVFPNDFFQTRTFNERMAVNTGNALGRWNHAYSGGSETQLQAYYYRFRRIDQGESVEGVADVDLQHRFRLGSRHDLVSGGGYRLNTINFRATTNFGFYPPALSASLYNVFFQDEIKLTDSLSLTAGSKLEHNAFTGFEYEPSAQLVWTRNTRTTVWVAAARAIRQPSWIESNARIDAATFPLENGGFGLIQFQANPETTAERLFDFEAGVRRQLNNRVSLDVTAFRSYYARLLTSEPGPPFFTTNPPPPHLVVPSISDNRAHARTYGGEVFVNWSVTRQWRISSGYSFLRMNVTRDASSNDEAVELLPGDSPRHQGQLRSTVNLPRNLEWDASAYYVGALGNGPIAGYTRLDTRLGWQMGEMAEFSVVGQNLLSPRRFEFANSYSLHSTQAQRSIFGKLTWRF
jgi:iron complex outermembrane receptor protein